jgi:hypothetical protein
MDREARAQPLPMSWLQRSEDSTRAGKQIDVDFTKSRAYEHILEAPESCNGFTVGVESGRMNTSASLPSFRRLFCP